MSISATTGSRSIAGRETTQINMRGQSSYEADIRLTGPHPRRHEAADDVRTAGRPQARRDRLHAPSRWPAAQPGLCRIWRPAPERGPAGAVKSGRDDQAMALIVRRKRGERDQEEGDADRGGWRRIAARRRQCRRPGTGSPDPVRRNGWSARTASHPAPAWAWIRAGWCRPTASAAAAARGSSACRIAACCAPASRGKCPSRLWRTARTSAAPAKKSASDPATGTCISPCTTRLIDREEASSTTSPIDQTFDSMISNGVTGITSRCSIVPCSRSRISAAPVRMIDSIAIW